MRRRQLIELEDMSWCPNAVRDGGTDWLSLMANVSGLFSRIAPKLRSAMTAAAKTRILDLCSGGGGPWLTLGPELRKNGEVSVMLSDLYPNVDALVRLRDRADGLIDFHASGIDATAVPAELVGVRTMFNAFHHFPPTVAAAVVADAVKKRRPIAIFEGINHRAIGLAAMPIQLPAILLLTPFVRPFRWSRMLLTYVIPLIPLIVLFDGTVSFLRVYLEDELRELVRTVPDHGTFSWDIGSVSIAGTPIGITHLIGVPK